MPKEVLDDVLENCVFLMLGEDAGVRAAFLPAALIGGKSVFAFYEMLYSKTADEQNSMVLHEIAHYVLGHSDRGLSDAEYVKQEEKANALKGQWNRDYKEYLDYVEKRANELVDRGECDDSSLAWDRACQEADERL